MELRLMIADADVDLLALCKQWCELKRISLQSVESGVDCLRELRQSPPDVLALALDLPWGGGDGVLAVMGQESRLNAIPVILLTSEESSARPRTASPANVIGRLTKPFQATDLLDVALSTASGQDTLRRDDVSGTEHLPPREANNAGPVRACATTEPGTRRSKAATDWTWRSFPGP